MEQAKKSLKHESVHCRLVGQAARDHEISSNIIRPKWLAERKEPPLSAS
jgi:hypothetical protein